MKISVGQKINNISILSKIGESNYRPIFKCLCACGKTFNRREDYLKIAKNDFCGWGCSLRIKISRKKQKDTANLIFKRKLRRYKLSESKYQEMLLAQNNKCKICNKSESRSNGKGGVTSLSIDHCHLSGKIRGLLCSKCNTILGNCKDNIDVLKKAIQYLSN